jgi:hypothetical protein
LCVHLGCGAMTDGTECSPPDPYDESDAVHIDDLPSFNGDLTASFAYDDDGNRFKVTAGDSYPRTELIPEERWRQNWMPDREGVGQPCAGCGEKIEWDAIIANDEYHLRCFVREENQREKSNGDDLDG